MKERKRSAYAEKLKDPRWQQLRLRVFERDGWACQICGSKEKTLHCHHMVYFYGNEPWEYSADHLATLCEECHEEETACKKESVERLLEALAINGAHSDAVSVFADAVMALGRSAKKSGASLLDAAAALAFFASDPLFVESLMERHESYGPWSEDSAAVVVLDRDLAELKARQDQDRGEGSHEKQ